MIILSYLCPSEVHEQWSFSLVTQTFCEKFRKEINQDSCIVSQEQTLNFQNMLLKFKNDCRACSKKIPRIFSPNGHCSETATNTHVSTYFCKNLGASVIFTNMRTVGFCVKTAIILQWKYTYVPNCTYIESMLINFIQISLCNISPMQAIVYLFKRDVAA